MATSPAVRNFLEALVAVLAGNTLYLLLMPHLPAVMRHSWFKEDWGLVVDFAVCTVIFVAVKVCGGEGVPPLTKEATTGSTEVTGEGATIELGRTPILARRGALERETALGREQGASKGGDSAKRQIHVRDCDVLMFLGNACRGDANDVVAESGDPLR